MGVDQPANAITYFLGGAYSFTGVAGTNGTSGTISGYFNWGGTAAGFGAYDISLTTVPTTGLDQTSRWATGLQGGTIATAVSGGTQYLILNNTPNGADVIRFTIASALPAAAPGGTATESRAITGIEYCDNGIYTGAGVCGTGGVVRGTWTASTTLAKAPAPISWFGLAVFLPVLMARRRYAELKTRLSAAQPDPELVPTA
ncbi:hypothetical protein KBY88_08265 [Cyanobium sp. Morenito 9A2]|nr:hypothetical protein [Cyanobium sp. Morenito 9A2]